MNYKEAKEEILPRWEEILQRITSPAKKRGEYVCPMCGHGAHGDGLKKNPRSTKYGLKCFGACGFSGDIIGLLQKLRGSDFTEALEEASSLLGISLDTPERVGQKQPKTERKKDTHTDMSIHTDTYTHTHTHTEGASEPEEKDYRAYYEECSKRLEEALPYLKERGISEATARAQRIGYDTQATPYGEANKTRWKGIIIPTSQSSYIIRNTDAKADKKQRYGKVGEVHLYHLEKALRQTEKPIVIVEGELDAVSILEVGGEAVGLGSTSNAGKLIEALKGRKLSQPLIIALDNDREGREASEELSQSLRELKLPFYVFNLYGQAKDANEALQRDRETFSKIITSLADQIRAEEERKLEEERREYLQTETAYGRLGEFLNGVKASVNTPATPTGFRLVDEILDGGLYEGLYCVGAITSLGKTTLALQIADQIASRTGKRILIFSLEMSRAELISKSLSRLTLMEVLKQGKDRKLAKTARGITDGDRYTNYSKAELEILDGALREYSSSYASKISIHEGLGDIGVQQIREEVARVKRLFGEAPIVIVDYLQILAPYNEEYIRATDKQNTDKNVVELKKLSRDYKTSIIGISSFNRDNYTQPVNLSSFKESGAIEYSSDVLIGLQLNGMDYEEGETDKQREKRIRDLRKEQEAKGRAGEAQSIQLKILKNRYGSKGDVILGFFPMFNYFVEDLEASSQPIRKKF